MVRASERRADFDGHLEANAHQLLLPTDDEGQNNVPKTISSTDNSFRARSRCRSTACRKIIRCF